MSNHRFELRHKRLRRAGLRLMQAAVLALLVTLAMPARATDTRAVKTRVSPVYPEIAKRIRVSGLVQLTVTVDAQGKVTNVQPLSGNRVLSAAAEEAVRNWRFEPGPSASTVVVAVTFAP
jgi:TonB family protein